MYTPDGWVLLKIHTEEGFLFKVFASWSGSYTYGDAWRVNSGISGTTVTDEYLMFEGYSGSAYKCYRNLEGNLSGYTEGVLKDLVSRAEAKLEIISSKELLTSN